MGEFPVYLNPGWIGVFLGAIGVAFGIYQIVRRTGPQLKYQYMNQSLIEAGGGLLPNEIVVQYDGKQVPRVSRSQIIIWNAGLTAVRGEDVIPDHLINFVFGGNAQILKVEITRYTRNANKSFVSVDNQDRKRFIYTFSFLDRNDGVLIRILHTGDNTQPKCLGTIIGMPKGVEYFGRISISSLRPYHQPNNPDYIPNFRERIVDRLSNNSILNNSAIILFCVLGFALIATAIFPNIATYFEDPPSAGERMLLAYAGFISVSSPLYVVWMNWRLFPISLAPEK